MKDGYYDGSGLPGLEMHTRDVYKTGQLVYRMVSIAATYRFIYGVFPMVLKLLQ